MKTLFLTIFLALVAASIFTYFTLPGAPGTHAVLYWVTDANPARVEQVRAFRNWLRKMHPEAPDVEVRVDAANYSGDKVLIQGVSGVCGDLIDHSAGGSLRFRHSVGMLEDITKVAKERGFDVSKTYPAFAPDLQTSVKVVGKDGETAYETRQFSYPCNVLVELLWVNRAAFEKVGMEPPPERWTVEDFERIGSEFVTRSNPTNGQQRVFFISDISPLKLARTMGVGLFNETGTAPAINRPEMIKCMNLRYKWIFKKPRLLPTASERAGFSASARDGGGWIGPLVNGQYALQAGGRYLLIPFRQVNKERVAAGEKLLSLSVSEPPYFEMPIARTGGRGTAIYSAGKQKQLALYFLEFLASPEYNMTIVRDADSLPPNPKYTQIEEFKHPPEYPEEWGLHEVFSEKMQTIAVPEESSPFIMDDVASRLVAKAFDGHQNNLLTAEEAVEKLDAAIRAEIQVSLNEDPDLRTLYEERCAVQRKIDARRGKGEKTPLSWISNVYWRNWYIFKEWAEADK